MAKVKIQGNASGTGVLTVTAPNTSTDRTITLPDSTGTLLSSEGAVTINDSGADVDFRVEGSGAANALFVQGSDGKVGIGTNSPTSVFEISGTGAQYSKVANGSNKAYMGVAGDNKAYFGSFSATDVVLAHGTSNKWTLNSSGNLFPAATSQGIVLGNTSDVAANRLDDYEEGTWTVGLRGSATSGNHTYHGRNGYYTKVGNAVHIQGGVHLNAIGTLDGNVYVTGLPFTTGTSGSAFSFSYGGGMSINAGTVPVGYSVSGVTEFYIRAWDVTSGTTDLNQSETPSGTQIIFSGTYFV